MIPNENRAIIRGTVISLNSNGPTSPSMIRVFCNDRIKGNYPSIYIFNPKLLEGISLQSKVFVCGHTQNRKVTFEDTGETGSKTIISADSIQPAERLCAEYFDLESLASKEGAIADDINRVTLCGKIIKKSKFGNKSDGFLRVRIVTDMGEYSTQCDITCSKREKAKADKFKVGDTIVAVCYVFTDQKKTENGKLLHYEQIFCRDIEKVIQ